MAFADFDQAYDPINPTSRGSAGSAQTYVVADGDDLRSIALAVWGDAGLWYLIASANGLVGTENLTPGMTLTIPAKVTNVHNKSSTFRVYDPNEILGDVEPTRQPAQVAPPKRKDCGGFGQILIAIVAIVVSSLVLGPASSAAIKFFSAGAKVASAAATAAGTIAGGAIAGAAGSIASQGVAVLTGMQDKFSWKGVAMSALAGGVGAGMRLTPLGQGTGMGARAATAAAGNALTQGLALASGLQSKFDWTGLAVSAVHGAVQGWADMKLDAAFPNAKPYSMQGMANSLASGMAGSVAGAATRSVIQGTDFGDNILADLPSVVANTIGNAVATRIQQAQIDAANAKERAKAEAFAESQRQAETARQARPGSAQGSAAAGRDAYGRPRNQAELADLMARRDVADAAAQNQRMSRNANGQYRDVVTALVPDGYGGLVGVPIAAGGWGEGWVQIERGRIPQDTVLLLHSHSGYEDRRHSEYDYDTIDRLGIPSVVLTPTGYDGYIPDQARSEAATGVYSDRPYVISGEYGAGETRGLSGISKAWQYELEQNWVREPGPGGRVIPKSEYYRNENNYPLPQSPAEARALHFRRLPEWQAMYHQNNTIGGPNSKWVHSDGREVVFYFNGRINNTPEDAGSFNRGANPTSPEHVAGDVIPYKIWPPRK